MTWSNSKLIFVVLAALLLFTTKAHAFGAGNIASISAVEGKNWRHGDIEDVLKTVACIKGHKWTSMMIKRVYFGNWLRDYSQAMDTGALKKAQPETIRILVWLLSFLSFGYATAEFEVTSERLGVYRPEEHIDNPKDYNDNQDARTFDQRLRGPVREIELQIDPETGMKNYIANEKGDWATSSAFIKYSFTKSIHHGRLYCNGHGFFKGKDEDLAEALRLMGQGLHTLEDFGAHTNYTELALRELGFNNVFPHVGVNTQMNVRGHHVFPLVTGTFGMVDFLHSVLGEATDHFTQSEVNEMDNALGVAQTSAHSSSPITTLVKLLAKVPGTKELCVEAEELQRQSDAQAYQNSQGHQNNQGYQNTQSYQNTQGYQSTQSQPGWGNQGGWRGIDEQPPFEGSRAAGDYNQYPAQQHHGWDQSTQGFPPPPPPQQHGWNQGAPPTFDPPPQQAHQQWNQPASGYDHQQQQSQQQPPAQQWQSNTPASNTPAQDQKPGTGLPGLPDFDPAKTVAQIYPILQFRDKVVRSISAVIEKIPGLEALVDKITETLTVFILSLLAPFVRPVISAVSKSLQAGSTTVIDSSAQHQFEPWTDPNCTDPTHSFLSKDHFSNVLNEPAGNVAAEIVKYVAPRLLYAWQDTSIPVEQVLEDCMKVFHHPALRDQSIEVHRSMFNAVKHWVDNQPDHGARFNDVLSAEGVKAGKNQKAGENHGGHTHNHLPTNAGGFGNMGLPFGNQPGQQHQSQQQSSGWSIPGFGGGQQQGQQNSSFGNPLGQLSHLPGMSNINSEINKFSSEINKFSSFIPGFGSSSGKREIDESEVGSGPEGAPYNQGQGYNDQYQHQPQPPHQSGGYPGYGEGSGYQGGSGPGGQADSYYRG